MNDKIDELEKKIYDIEKKIDKILNILESNIAPNCSRMNSHISFIESVYNNIKSPMDYICNSINRFRLTNN
jgi:hypothetical protein